MSFALFFVPAPFPTRFIPELSSFVSVHAVFYLERRNKGWNNCSLLLNTDHRGVMTSASETSALHR
jgi:hypothetical protein